MKKIIAFIAIGAYLAWFSIFIANLAAGTDFPVFYYAACTICDPSSSNIMIYDENPFNKYSVPDNEFQAKNDFLYSMPIAFILSPLCFLSYYNAKAVLIFLGIFCYLLAIAITLHLNEAKNRWFVYPLTLSFLFFPFINNVLLSQINSLILVLVSFSTFFAVTKRPYLCGSLLAFAGLFKIYPIAIAMVLGLKNWRIIVSCSFVFVLSFLIPDSLEWIHAISNVNKTHAAFLFLTLGTYWFMLYAVTIALLTAYIVLRTKNTNFPLLVSFAIPAVFLTMPIIEYHHLVLMAQPYIYVLTKYKTDRFLIGFLILSFIFISAALFFGDFTNSPEKHLFSKILRTFGLLSFWGALAKKIIDDSITHLPQ